MNYKYENYELESLTRYLKNNNIRNFIEDIMCSRHSTTIEKLDNFEQFKEMYNDIINILSLSCKFGANNELHPTLFKENGYTPITEYKSYLNDSEDTHFMFNNFTLLNKKKRNNDDKSFYMDDNFVSTNETPFINIYDLLGDYKDTYLLPPFIDVIYGMTEEEFEILPYIAPNETIDDWEVYLNDEDLHNYYLLSKDKDTTNLKKLSHKTKNSIQNTLIDLHYKYMTQPKVDLINKKGKSL